MKRKSAIISLTLLAAISLVAMMGILPSGIPSVADQAKVEASSHDSEAPFQQLTTNQQAAISDAIAAHGVDTWHEAGFTGAGVKIGVIDRGFAGIQEHMGTELPEPVGVRCYSLVTDPNVTDNFTENIADCEHAELGDASVGAAVLEAVYDFAPDAEYYIASISQDSFYHFDLQRILEWMNGEGVDLILFTHDGGWSGPGDGTSIYAASELLSLDRAVSYGITWISPTGDRAMDTWSGIFTDEDGDGVHEFAPGVECNDVDLGPNSLFAAQLRWNDPWMQSTRDLEADLVNKDTGLSIAFSGRHDNFPRDPNELLTFLTPDAETSYCVKVVLKSENNSFLFFNLQSYNGHSFDLPSIYGSVTSPAESINPGMLAVGASAWDNTAEIRPFSGRGPMNNRTTKPDIVGGDGAHSAVLGSNWASTAQAAAHVTGMAALVKQRFPDYTPAMIAEYLRDNAESRPAEVDDLNQSTDNNNTWGHGFAMLPNDVEDVMPPMVDTCIQSIDGAGVYTGTWNDTCLSENRPMDEDAGSDYYARFFTFTLDRSANVTVSLNSEEDAYLYLMYGSGKSGEVVASNDDVSRDDTNSMLTTEEPLGAGSYTIEASTYRASIEGTFTLDVEVEFIDGSPPVAPKKYLAFSNGTDHVCAIAEDGSIDCWGDDTYGQVSERPRTGSFSLYAQIGSGANHTCALRDDRALICWGSIDLP